MSELHCEVERGERRKKVSDAMKIGKAAQLMLGLKGGARMASR